ncbi:MAG: outer membrane protein assembly factor BamE [Desulfobaccales bacterium]
MAVRICSKFVSRRGLGRLVLVALVIAGLAGCGSKISKHNFDQIKLGMTQEEVQGILGTPSAATGLEIPVFSGTTSKWAQGDMLITVQFVNGQVVAKEFSQPAPK